MRITLDKKPIGMGDLLYHVTTYGPPEEGEHGHMHLVQADNLAKALYTGWLQHYDDTVPFDIAQCDGYLIGHIESNL